MFITSSGQIDTEMLYATCLVIGLIIAFVAGFALIAWCVTRPRDSVPADEEPRAPNPSDEYRPGDIIDTSA
jgi:hypothetical protein